MNELNFSVQDIKELMAAMHQNRMGRLEIEQENLRLVLEAQAAGALPGAAAPVAADTPELPGPGLDGRVVTAPIVGTFYAAPAPDKPPYVRQGQQVKKGDVLFIIESMKLMNEVVSDYDGVIGEILVENAKGVEFGQPVLTIL